MTNRSPSILYSAGFSSVVLGRATQVVRMGLDDSLACRYRERTAGVRGLAAWTEPAERDTMNDGRLSQQQIAHALRHFIIGAALWAAYGPNATVAGAIYSGFALKIGLSEAQIAFLVSLASLAGASELVTVFYTRRVRRKRAFMVLVGHFEILAASCSVLMALVAPQHRFVGIAGLMVLSYFLGHTVSPLYSSWMSNVVPEDMRATYTGRRMFIVTVVSAMYLYLASVVVDRAEGLTGFYAVFSMGCLAGLAGYWMLGLTPIPALELEGPRSFTRSLLQPWLDRRFAVLAAFMVSWTVATSVAGPFYGVYMLKYLGLSYSRIALYTNLALGCMLIGYLAAGGLAQRYGCKPLAQLLMVPGMIAPLLWVFTGRETYQWLIPVANVLGGFAGAGLTVAMGSLLYKVVPQGVENSVHFATWTGLSATAAALGPLVGGSFRDALPEQLVVGGLQISPLQMIFGASGLLCLVPLMIAALIVEPEATSPRYLLGQFRGNLLSFAWNFALYQVARDDETRAEALRRLGRSGTPLAVGQLVKALEHVSPQVRAEAAKGLGEGGFPEAVPPLVEALEDQESDIRPEAAEALGKIGHSAAAAHLLKALGDPDIRVRTSAVLALGEVGGREAADALLEALRGPFDRQLFPTLVDAATRRADLRLVEPVMVGLRNLHQPVIRMQVLNGVCRVLGEKNHFYRLATAEPLQRAAMSEPMMERVVGLLGRARGLEAQEREHLKESATVAAAALARDDVTLFADCCRDLAHRVLAAGGLPPIARHAARAMQLYLAEPPEELMASEGVVFLIIALTALGRSLAGQHPTDRARSRRH